MIDLAGKPCCVCGSTRSELLWTTTWPEHGYPGEFSMRRCSGCRLLFNSPRLDDAELGKLYGRNYYFFMRQDAREIRRIVAMVQRTVALVVERVREKRSLDIGCGRGYLPAVMQKLGWDARGVEIAQDAAEYGRQRFGLDVFTGTIEQYVKWPDAQQFPLVTAIDVLEHVPSPDSFAEASAKTVERGGWLIIDTPNGAARNIDVKKLQWRGFNPFHIYLFTVESLTKLLTRHGLIVEQAFSYGNRLAQREPVSRQLRDGVARQLKRIGLIRPATAMYYKMRDLGPAETDTEGVLSETLSEIRKSAPFTQTNDATEELSAGARGDNIVVIARKSG
jgi:2-polyprenyl-3-methyl-5-hydroxy-6-metoxy-1,4-benzoquinol methylase